MSGPRKKLPINNLNPIRPARSGCLVMQDQSVIQRSAVDLFDLRGFRDPNPQAARLADQFILQNRSIFPLLDASVQQVFDGRHVKLLIKSGNAVGALPLISPTSARFDYGLLIQPRFDWTGLGSMLLQMGWRVTPTPLRLPLLSTSERNVPAWVLSLMVLSRLEALLDTASRRFDRVEETLHIPKGTILWNDYATRSIPRGDLQSVRCSFSDLREDPDLIGAIRYVAESQLGALESQKQHGPIVHRLIEMARGVIRRVSGFRSLAPAPVTIAGWLRRPLRNSSWIEGIEAIAWTIQERGLAGTSALGGVPWVLRMDAFYEAWVEIVFGLVAKRIGAQLRVGRLRQTVHSIDWRPPSFGSQKALIPDLSLEAEGLSILVDAKYKRHLEELQFDRWTELGNELQEQHRDDLFQALAYGHLGRSAHVIVCLAYPCSQGTWRSLKERDRMVHEATIQSGEKKISVWLAAVPMVEVAENIAAEVAGRIFSRLGLN